MLDGLSFDPFSFQPDGLAAPEVDIGRREIAQALVVAVVVVVADKGFDLCFKIAGQIVVFQQDAVLEGMMPSLDLALSLGMIRSAANVLHIAIVEPFRQIAGDITGAVLVQQPWLVNDRCLIAS